MSLGSAVLATSSERLPGVSKVVDRVDSQEKPTVLARSKRSRSQRDRSERSQGCARERINRTSSRGQKRKLGEDSKELRTQQKITKSPELNAHEWKAHSYDQADLGRRKVRAGWGQSRRDRPKPGRKRVRAGAGSNKVEEIMVFEFLPRT